MAIIFVIVGTVITLAGLVAIAPQVRVHEIAVKSKAAWIFRAGAALLVTGQLWALTAAIDPAVKTTALIMGGAILFAALTIISHERQQAGYNFRQSLSLQVFSAGALIFILAFLLR